MDTQEKDLIQQTQEGNHRAFEHLVLKYKNEVYTLALRMIQNTEEAEETAQDVFLQVYKSIHQFRGDSKFSTWLFRITYNLSINKIKSLKNKPLAIDLSKYDKHLYHNELSGLEKMQKDEAMRFIYKAIEKLPEQERFIISLYYFDELSLKEIAEVVGIKEGNVKIKLYRSRAFLYEELKNSVLNVKTAFYE
jgi:RNA polymerase sigma-70 factor (ECF subfamily)